MAAIVLIGAFFLVKSDKNLFASILQKNEKITSEEAETKAVSFIDELYIRGSAEITPVETKEESGVYRVRLSIEGEELDVFITVDGKILFPEGIDVENMVVFERTIGSFTKIDDDLCQEDGKPIVYFFGTKDCPYCSWQKPITIEAMEPFKDQIVFKDNSDTENDLDIFFKYSDGGVPLVVMGCKYFRVGAGGYEGDETKETDNLRALACKLTNGEPKEICDGLTQLIDQI